MAPENLDRIDQGILFLLQSDARNVTTEEIGERIGVAASTVASRINRLEDAGVVTGYRPEIDYAESGFDQHLLVVGTAAPDERERLAEDAVALPGVVRVAELATDEENVTVEVVGASQTEIERRLEALSDLGIRVSRTEVLKQRFERPFDTFGEQYTTDE